ncbi:MAG TPA: PAS domain S-box protein [Methyloversatilis sp.]
MKSPDLAATRRRSVRCVFFVTLGYVLVSALWILLSDQALERFAPSPSDLHTRLSIAKGWFFVAVTATGLYLMMRRQVTRLLDALTRQEAAQAERTRTVALLDSFVTSSSDPMFAKDMEGRYLLCNPEACRLLGIAASDVLGKDDHSLHLPAGAAQVMANDRKVIAGGQVVRFEERLHTADGDRVYLSTKGPLRDADGKLLGTYGIARDITDWIHSEEALRDSEQRFRMLFEHFPVAYQSLDDQGRFLHVNPVLCQLLGYTEGELLGRSFSEVWMPHLRSAFPATFDCYKRNLTLQGEVRLQHRDGHEIVAWAVGRVQSDAQGRFMRTHCVLADITERTAAARAVQERELLLREIGELAHIGAWELDVRTGQLTSTEETHRIYDTNPGETISVEARLALYLDEGRARLEAALKAATEHGEPYDLELEIVTARGNRKWVRTLGSPVFEDGQVVRLRGTLQDITERKLAEQSIRMLSRAVEQSPAGVVITDRSGCISYANDAFVLLSGREKRSLIGSDLRFLYPPAGRTQQMWRAFDEGRAWQGEFVGLRANGRESLEFLGMTPIRQPEGLVTHFVTVVQDISERKRMEEELQRHRDQLEELVQTRTSELAVAKESAESASRSKSVFLANMSHEIRTPMNAIVGLTHLLSQTELDVAQRERLKKIADSAGHLQHILDDVLDLSKIEANKVSIEKVDFSIDALFDQAYSMMLERARERGLYLHTSHEGVPPVLCGDVTRLRQALLNYLSNAVKFTEHGGITLSARLVEKTGDQVGDSVLVHFEVQDTGVGIAPPDLARLFVSFEQADASTTRKYGGSGLGLAITRRLAQLMGGDAGATSTPGSGSTFWFSARLTIGASDLTPVLTPGTAQGAAATLRKTFPDARLLLVEDNPINREVALALLAEAGLKADTAADGVEALERVAVASYDLVLMDMQMPRMDGLEATRRLRSMEGWKTVPILAMTANAFDEDRRACMAAGMDDFISKPADPAAFYTLLLRWLTRNGRPPQARPELPEVAPDVLHDLIGRLIPLLEAGDTGAGALARESADAFEALGEPGRRFLRELAAFDYESALLTAHDIDLSLGR